MFILGFKEMQKSKFKITAWAAALTLLAPSFAFAATTVSGNVYGNDGTTIKGASVVLGIPPDTELPPATSQDQGKFTITVPDSIAIPAAGVMSSLSASFNAVSAGPHSVTIKPNQDNPFPLLLRLGVAGNSTSPSGPGGSLSSGIIKYTSPDLSPIFKSKQYETLGDYLTDLVKVAMVLSVIAATLVVVYAGFDYLNSGGSPEGTAHAKEMIAGALIGLATVFLMSVFLVSLYDKETLKNLAPPPEGSEPASQGSTAVGAVEKEIDKIFSENTVPSSQNQSQTKITRVTTPSCPTTTKGIEGIIRLEGCRAANRVASELRARPKKETCDKELFTNYALKQNQYDPATKQSSFDNFNTGFIKQCKKIRGTS